MATTSISILDALKKIAPNAKVDLAAIASTLETQGAAYGVNTDARLRAFLAQAAEETAGFKTLTEYASGAAYEGRTDLGNTQPGDGVKFKGRGIFQITGRGNYKDVSNALFKDTRLLDHPELLAQPVNATLSALYFWKTRTYKGKSLNSYADAGDLQSITKAINGGLNGWADRLSYYDKLKLFVFNHKGAITTIIIIGVVVTILAGYYVYRIEKAA